MEQHEITRFTVCVTGTDGGTWQGTVEAEGERFQFQSEMQLLRWLWKRCPALLPDRQSETGKEEIRR